MTSVSSIPDLLGHFRTRYESTEISRLQGIVAIGASHHRLAWIHPFRDGNGRVVRLFSEAVIRRLGIDSGGLWSLSRGLSLQRREYYDRLANADQVRSSTSADDGRGHLSERALWDFCHFTLTVMVDQIAFMDRMLEVDGLERRIDRHVHVVESAVAPEADRVFLLLREALVRGQFPRGEAGRIVGASERTGRLVLALAVEAGLLHSDTPKSPVRLALPAKVLDGSFRSSSLRARWTGRKGNKAAGSCAPCDLPWPCRRRAVQRSDQRRQGSSHRNQASSNPQNSVHGQSTSPYLHRRN